MTEQTQFEKGRSAAMTFGGLVYTGVVLAATTLFISFILTAFPETAYFSRFIMVIAGLMIGASMLAFPVALHTWAISGHHRTVTTLLYYGEMAIVAINTIVSFAALLYKYSGTPLPDWIAWYEPFAVVSMVYTLAAWGTIFLTDPQAKAKAKELQAEQEFTQRVAQKRLEYLNSIEGEEAVMAAANASITKSFGAQNFSNEPQHFGKARKQSPILADSLFKNEAETDHPRLEEKPSGNKFQE